MIYRKELWVPYRPAAVSLTRAPRLAPLQGKKPEHGTRAPAWPCDSATWTRCHGTPSCMSHRAERRSNGSQTRSARSIRVSTCDKAPKIRTAVGRDKVFCVSVDRIARAISREGISTPKLVFVRNRLTSLDFAAQSSVASIPSTPNYESTRPPGRT
jgi:hypothetical protein